MVMCATRSARNFTSACTPDSDTNIFDNPSKTASDFIGRHPGTAFMELQFYPPGWVYGSGTQWIAALTIDSFSVDQGTGQQNNADCINKFGLEPINDKLITTDGTAAGTPFAMNIGDKVVVSMFDTADGFKAVLNDLTTGQQGSMTASIANNFFQVVFDPSAATCSTAPYAFHPMYSTSSPHTRPTWTAHSLNVAMAFEIGHWEYCSAVSFEGGVCTSGGDVDMDDASFCDAS